MEFDKFDDLVGRGAASLDVALDKFTYTQEGTTDSPGTKDVLAPQ